MRSFILVISLISLATAAPFVIPSLVRYDQTTSTRISASSEALAIASTEFTLVASNEPGCANKVAHAEVADIPEGESEDVEGVITFPNIRVNGQTCGTGGEDEVMLLYSHDVLNTILPGGKVLNLSFEGERAVSVGGADLEVRRCGSWIEEYPQRYAFSTDIMRLLPSLSENGFINNSTISAGLLVGDDMWMVSAPQDGPGRVCLYKYFVEKAAPKPVPTITPDPDDDDDDSDDDSPGPGDGEDSSDSNTGDGIFGDANAEALAMEEEEANKEPACFPGSALVHLEDGTVKTMAELELGDRVMVAPSVFSEVFMFTHRLRDGDHKFIKFETDSGKTLTATAGHYVYINKSPMTAGNASVGDTLELTDGSKTAITSVTTVTDRGLYNPQTVTGDVIVNGIRASTYTVAVEPSVAHALLAPFRALSYLHFRTAYFDGGADSRLVRMISMGRVI